MSAEAVLDFFRHMATQSGPLEVHEGGGGSPRARLVCGFLAATFVRLIPCSRRCLGRFISDVRKEHGEATGCRS